VIARRGRERACPRPIAASHSAFASASSTSPRTSAAVFDFVEALIEDRIEKAKDEDRYPYGGQPGGWENSKIESYLEAALAWARDSRNVPTGLPSDLPGTASPPSSTAARSTSDPATRSLIYEQRPRTNKVAGFQTSTSGRIWGDRRGWSYTGGDGRNQDVQPGQSAPIRDGQRINFGRVEGEIRARGS
jgi:hypothetical protein